MNWVLGLLIYAMPTAYLTFFDASCNKDDYQKLRKSLEKVDLFTTIEVATNNQGFRLQHSAKVKQYRVPNNVYQKYALFNKFLETLPSGFTQVVWIDANIEVGDTSFQNIINDSLKEFQVVQLFKTCSYENRDFRSIVDDPKNGHPGIGWAFRREVLNQVGFYESAMIENGDFLNAAGIVGINDHDGLRYLNSKHRSHFFEWGKRMYEAVGGSVGSVDVGVSLLSRPKQPFRMSSLKDRNYDPSTALKKSHEGWLIIDRDDLNAMLMRERRSNHKASVLMLSWRRPENITRVIDTIHHYDCVDEILVLNNNQNQIFQHPFPKVTILNSNNNLGMRCRWILGALAKNDYLVFIDDDTLPDEQTIERLLEGVHADPLRLYSLHGRAPTTENDCGTKNIPNEAPIVLLRTAAMHRKFIPLVLAKETEFFKKHPRWPTPQEFPAEDIFLSYCVYYENKRSHQIVHGEYLDLAEPSGLRQNQLRSKWMREIQEFFRIQPIQTNAPKKWSPRVSIQPSKKVIPMAQICTTFGKECGVANFAANLATALKPFNFRVTSTTEYVPNEAPVTLIQHEYGLINEQTLIDTLKQIKGKKFLFAHTGVNKTYPRGVAQFENLVDGFACMCDGMIPSKKPVACFPHPGYVPSKIENRDALKKKFGLEKYKCVIGSNGFITSVRDFGRFVRTLLPHAIEHNWCIFLPASKHHKHDGKVSYVKQETDLLQLSQIYPDNFKITFDFMSQHELCERLHVCDLVWCWTDVISKCYGSGTCSDQYGSGTRLIYADKEQHCAVNGLPNTVRASEDFEEFMRTLLDEALSGNYPRHDPECLSWETCITPFVNMIYEQLK